MRNFVNKYGKWIAVGIVVISFGLLAIPGFLNLPPYSLSGYEMIFRAKYAQAGGINVLAKNGNYDVCVIGIIALVLMLLSAVAFILDKNSSALDIFGGILLALAGIIFLAMQGWAIICYKRTNFTECGIGCIAYIIGGFELLFGVVMTYKGFAALKEEKKNPKATVGYSYLKK